MSHRGGFSSRLGFVAAAAGSAVGLGNVWKFPFEVGSGGGAAFVVMYLAFCFILCFPVMVCEITIGRKTQLNPVDAFAVLGFKNFSIIGKLGLLSGVLILSFYNVVAGWALGYFIEIITGNFDIGKHFSEFVKDIIKVGTYAAAFMIATAYVVAQGISKGIEKTSKILMPTLIIIILGLALYGLSLPNAMQGLEFYLLPDFSKITFEVVYKALGQAFFSLSLGMGALITYGSYLGKNENIITSAALITLADVGIAFIAGLMLFPLVFYQGVAPTGGPGLIFVTLPAIFETLGASLGVIIGSFFFALLSFAALTSTVSLLEVPVAHIVDRYKVSRKTAAWGVAIFIFLAGIPSLLANGKSDLFTYFIIYFGTDKATDFMTFVGHVANDTFLPLGGCMITVFCAYAWKKNNMHQEISKGFPAFKQSFIAKYLDITISYICPLLLGLLFVLTVLSRFFGINLIGV